MSMLNKIVGAVLLLAVVVLTADGRASETCRTGTGSLTISDSVVRIEGDLDDAMLDCARTVLGGPITKLVVRSTGGRSSQAIDLGRLIAEKDIPIQVDTICAAACAQFLLPAGRVIVVYPQDLILFFNTSTSMLQVLGDRDWRAVKFYRDGAVKESAYYSERKVDQRLLWISQFAMDSRCISRHEGLDDESHVTARTRFFASVIPREMLEKFGMHFEGRFADTMSDILDGLKSGQIPFAKNMIYGLTFVVRFPQPGEALKELPECPTN